MSSSTRTKRKDQDRSSHSGKKRDDDAYSESTPRVVPDLVEDFAGLNIDSSQNEPEFAAEQDMESPGKGKEKLEDWSEDWSSWAWDEKYNCWYRTRQDAQGNWEYDYGPVIEESGNRTDVC